MANVKMGKKGTSGKAKKFLRKQETERAVSLAETVRAASQIEDLLELFPAFQSYESKGLAINITYYRSSNLPEDILQWAFNLCKANMQALYETTWGWVDKKKMSELKDENARFLIAWEKNCEGVPLQPVAFLHFRFEVEDGIAVLYIYELQLEARIQKKGLGKRLMQIAEFGAIQCKMQELMLTVQLENISARNFYGKLGYSVANGLEQDPGQQDGYLILSKKIQSKCPGVDSLKI